MKKILFVLFCALISANASLAQIENIRVSDAINVDQLYAGALSWTSFKIDSLDQTSTTNFRVGALTTWRPASYLALQGMTIYDRSNNTDWAMNQFSIIVNPTKALKITAGNTGTLITEQRPLPTSAAGQFETWAQAQIPGGALCAKASYQINSNYLVGAGITAYYDQPRYEAKVAYKKLVLSGYYEEYSKKWGSVFTLSAGRWNSTLVWRQDDRIGNTITFDAGKNKDYCLYSDIGWSFDQNKLLRGEWGVLKTFSGKYIKGLIGPGYCYEDRSIHGYLWIHL